MPTRPEAPLLPPDDSVGTLVHRAVDDAREVARAEIALFRAKATERLTAYKNAAIFFSVAGVLALAAIIALLVGLILTVATLIGPGWATAIVIGVTLAIAAVLGVIGTRQLAPPEKGR